MNAVGANTGPDPEVGIFWGETGKEKRRSSVVPDNLGRDSSLRMTGCARERGDRDTLDGDTSPGARVIGGRSVDVLVRGPGVDISRTLAGGSK